jgi:hypothetical protein
LESTSVDETDGRLRYPMDVADKSSNRKTQPVDA